MASAEENAEKPQTRKETMLRRRTVNWQWGDIDSEDVFEQLGDGYSKYPLSIEEQLSAILKLTQLYCPLKLIDIGCGYGNQAIEFAKKGCEVAGIDLSRRSIAKAISNAETNHVNIDFKACRAAEITESGKFDLAISLWHTLGFMAEDEVRAHFQGIGKCIRSKGKYFLHLADCMGESAELKPRKNWRDRGDKLIMSERHSEGLYRIETCLVVDIERDEIITFIDKKRWYSLSEIASFIDNAGMSIDKLYSDWNGTPGNAADKTIIVCTKN